MRTCSVQDCEKTANTGGGARGWCSKHYNRWKRGQSIEGKSRFDTTLQERFWSLVQRDTDGCWLWTGSKNLKGYGHFRVGGFIYKAHRWAWEEEHGMIDPPELTIDHVVCATSNCVRPSHMELVTRAENTRRARALRKIRDTGA